MSGTRAVMLPDGRRLHLQHGPIDLIVEAWGTADEIRAAYAQAVDRFRTMLNELVAELPMLRRPVNSAPPQVSGSVARRMVAACGLHTGMFITPMAAVAGAVADEVLSAMLMGRRLRRAYVNNGGDIALHLACGERFEVGIVAELAHPRIAATTTIEASMPVRGIATSGQGGRSFSLGIADAVTVLAHDGAAADAAATLIANAVDVNSSTIRHRPARSLQEDSDLGELSVVVAVGPLSDDDVDAALEAGLAEAERMRLAGLIEGAYLSLRGHHRTTGLSPILTHSLSLAPSPAGLGEGRGEGPLRTPRPAGSARAPPSAPQVRDPYGTPSPAGKGSGESL